MAKATGDKSFDKLLAYLHSRRETFLNSWREACIRDATLSSKGSFSREEFNDQVPVLLDILEQRLLGITESDDVINIASEHGLHRWQAGYDLHELIIEFEHLFRILQEYVQKFVEENPKLGLASVTAMYSQLSRTYADSVRGSVSYYYRLRQTSAAEQAANLQSALEQLQTLNKKRSEHLRQSAHDLRSSFSIAMMASQMWDMPASEKERAEIFEMLNRNLVSIRDMLLQLTDFSKIEAGQEIIENKDFDVSELLRSLIRTTLPLAEKKQISLEGEGPEKMVVHSDPILVQRIFQNLVHNALKYTEIGGVFISWANESNSRWILSIQDTGPGFAENSAAALFAEQLKPSIHTTAIYQEGKMLQSVVPTKVDKNKSTVFKESEGLGLVIVKKICELMKATMDMESKPGQGTLVRIRFPSVK
ncbi:sensor histidine kinase [Dyadobacter luticola]|uniref:histidine kinase n=1 Tax=Dyadobacter luticola TaxID=1979387 RepID=A0A5R9L533_9BACT|nr:sensor histidine kinase [Dyadobacter luticola]TLV03467.1 sensor histidine kinase [Dyadobacter luticola]